MDAKLTIYIDDTTIATVTFLDDKQKFKIGIQTTTPDPDISAYQGSGKAWGWVRTFQNSLREFYFMKENSDMGLTHLVRILYLYGTPAAHSGHAVSRQAALV
jgi:hypothetical protein